jgi:hypothetical protein
VDSIAQQSQVSLLPVPRVLGLTTSTNGCPLTVLIALKESTVTQLHVLLMDQTVTLDLLVPPGVLTARSTFVLRDSSAPQELTLLHLALSLVPACLTPPTLTTMTSLALLHAKPVLPVTNVWPRLLPHGPTSLLT